jgi:hypothetical protein
LLILSRRAKVFFSALNRKDIFKDPTPGKEVGIGEDLGGAVSIEDVVIEDYPIKHLGSGKKPAGLLDLSSNNILNKAFMPQIIEENSDFKFEYHNPQNSNLSQESREF